MVVIILYWNWVILLLLLFCFFFLSSLLILWFHSFFRGVFNQASVFNCWKKRISRFRLSILAVWNTTLSEQLNLIHNLVPHLIL
jgi:hypothetical protein